MVIDFQMIIQKRMELLFCVGNLNSKLSELCSSKKGFRLGGF